MARCCSTPLFRDGSSQAGYQMEGEVAPCANVWCPCVSLVGIDAMLLVVAGSTSGLRVNFKGDPARQGCNIA